jgi:hypothetical protein
MQEAQQSVFAKSDPSTLLLVCFVVPIFSFLVTVTVSPRQPDVSSRQPAHSLFTVTVT